MEYESDDRAEEALHHPDPIDRASAEDAIRTADAMKEHELRVKAQHVPPGEPREVDGEVIWECACGCGREVNPLRIKAGYGLAIECATMREAKSRKR